MLTSSSRLRVISGSHAGAAAVLPARTGPSQQRGCPSGRCHQTDLPGGHHPLHILQLIAVAYPHCCSSTSAWREKAGSLQSRSSGGARASPWVLIAVLALLFPPAICFTTSHGLLYSGGYMESSAPGKHRHISAYKTESNNPLCSGLNTETGARVCANFHLSLGSAVVAERRRHCGLRFGWP